MLNKCYLNIYKFRYFRKSSPILCWDGTYDGLCDLLYDLIVPVIDRSNIEKKYFIQPPKYMNSIHSRHVEKIETFSRSFIGASYLIYSKYLDNNRLKDIVSYYKKGIIVGCNPSSDSYWGGASHLLIENTSIIIGLLLNKKDIWDKYSTKEQEIIITFFQKYVSLPCYQNNWLWFKIFHLLFLEEMTNISYENEINEAFCTIDKMYIGNGWYMDGLKGNGAVIDYYTAWGMQYYSLMFSFLFEQKYKERAVLFNKRANIFADTYQYYFTQNGSHPIYGRSQLYRFAAISPFGFVIKNGWKSNSHPSQFKKALIDDVNIFLKNGSVNPESFLTMGILGPDKNILEDYSGSGSPYWAFKLFSLLLIDRKHQFWTAESNKDLVPSKSIITIIKNKQIIAHDGCGSIILVDASNNHNAYSWKYNKFVYTNIYGNDSEPRICTNENMISFIINRNEYTLYNTYKSSCQDNRCSIEWGLDEKVGVFISTEIISMYNGYFFYHRFKLEKKENIAITGFAVGANCLNVLKRENNYISLSSNNNYISTMHILHATNQTMILSQSSDKKNATPIFESVVNNGGAIAGVCLRESNFYAGDDYSLSDQGDYFNFLYNNNKYRIYKALL